MASLLYKEINVKYKVIGADSASGKDVSFEIDAADEHAASAAASSRGMFVSSVSPLTDVDEKICPFCSEFIKSTAIKCRHCGEFLVAQPSGHTKTTTAEDSTAPTFDLINAKLTVSPSPNQPVIQRAAGRPAGRTSRKAKIWPWLCIPALFGIGVVFMFLKEDPKTSRATTSSTSTTKPQAAATSPSPRSSRRAEDAQRWREALKQAHEVIVEWQSVATGMKRGLTRDEFRAGVRSAATKSDLLNQLDLPDDTELAPHWKDFVQNIVKTEKYYDKADEQWKNMQLAKRMDLPPEQFGEKSFQEYLQTASSTLDLSKYALRAMDEILR